MLRRPSPSMVVALLALFIAVGGSAYAVRTIDGKLLKNRSVTGKKLKPNTLGGRQIAESKLRRVPLSARAENADNAAFADTAALAQTAANAQTAGSATSAASADKATSADDAAKVGGLSISEIVKGSSSATGSCDPDDTDLFITACQSVTISNPAIANVLVLATGTWFGADGAAGTCTLRRGADASGAAGQATELGQDLPVHINEASGAAFSLAHVFTLVSAGDQGFAVACTENTAPNIQFANVRVTAIRLSGTQILIAP